MKMNKIVKKFLWTGYKSMPVRQLPALDKSGFTYVACRPFTKKKKERTQTFKETVDLRYTVGAELGLVGTARTTKIDCKNDLEIFMGV